MKHLLLFALVTALGSLSSLAAPQKFDFKDPKGVNNIVFKTDALLESINGTASGISGTVTYDPTQPTATTGKIMLAAKSLHVGNPVMKEHMHGDKWLDVAKYPDITFEITGMNNDATADNSTVAQATGNLTIKGVTKKVTVPVKLTYLKDKLKARFPQLEGDLLVVRSTFTIKRSDYNISAGNAEEKVADEIELSLSLAGQSPR